MTRELKTFQIFEAGTHTPMSGNTITIAAFELETMAAVYDPAKYAAPLVLGHPTLEDPSYGNVVKLFLDGIRLFATAEVNPDLVQWVREKRYTTVSASFYPPGHANNPVPHAWYLNHVGFLGAAAPAVKGMQPLQFSAGRAIVNPLIADAERRCRSTDRASTSGAVGFSDGLSPNPLVRDAERRANQARGPFRR